MHLLFFIMMPTPPYTTQTRDRIIIIWILRTRCCAVFYSASFLGSKVDILPLLFVTSFLYFLARVCFVFMSVSGCGKNVHFICSSYITETTPTRDTIHRLHGRRFSLVQGQQRCARSNLCSVCPMDLGAMTLGVSSFVQKLKKRMRDE